MNARSLTIEKTFTFENPELFEFDENGIGKLIAGENRATINWNDKTAEVQFEGEVFKLKEVGFDLTIERQNISGNFFPKFLTPEELIIKVPDVIVWGKE
jgi:hypothetical protein